MRGMQQLLNTIDRVRAKLNPKLKLDGILPTIFKGRTLHSQEVLQVVKQSFGDCVYPFPVKDSIRFAETPLAGTSILQYADGTEGAQSYRALAASVLENHNGR